MCSSSQSETGPPASPFRFPPLGPVKMIHAEAIGSGRAILHITRLDDAQQDHTLTRTQVLCLLSDLRLIAQQ